MRSLLTLCLLALLPNLLLAKDNDEDTAPIKFVKLDRKDPVTYEKDVEPILYQKCVVCHRGATPESKFALSSYEQPVKAAHLSLVEALAFSPDGKLLASGSFQEVSLWDIQTGTLKQKLTGFAHRVVALAFSPDGKLLATGGGAPTEDGEIKVFDTATW